MNPEPQRTCPSCGNEFSGAMEFCPVCMLRKGLAGGVESSESSASEEAVNPTPEQPAQRFEHYELVAGEDGKPVELGRGAMGQGHQKIRSRLRSRPQTTNPAADLRCTRGTTRSRRRFRLP
jgi:hypothetical protein